MAFKDLFTDASSLMTVVSFVTFLCIIGWTFSRRRSADFAAAAQLPFADEVDEVAEADKAAALQNPEKHHV
jgi:cytochrome c oxidase cbb3-type subunit IV